VNLSNNTILITGGGSGIGLALAKELFVNNRVLICGRNIERLQQVKNKFPKIEIIQCDISNEESVIKLIDEIELKYASLNFLINNAGVMNFWNLTKEISNPTELNNEIQTNLIGTIGLTQGLLPHLLKQENGIILNVSSALAFVPMSAAPIYSATKAALHSYSISLRQQLENTNTKVFELLPAAIDTEMAINMKKGIGMQNQGKDMSPEKLAELTITALRKDRLEIRPGMANMLYKINQILPSVARKMISIQSKKILNKINNKRNEQNNRH